ncbi:MAG: T9SS type A sorting domain-containing protein [Cellulophaga sp.]
MKQFLMTYICIAFCYAINGQTSSNKILARSTVGVSGTSEKLTVGGKTYVIQQSIGQSSITGTHKTNKHALRQGFIQPSVWNKIITKNVPLNLEVTLYPNPFTNFISLVFNEKISGNVTVALFDLTGRKVFTEVLVANQELHIKTNHLPSASYILRVAANRKQFANHIIKN